SPLALGGFWYQGSPADRDWRSHDVPQDQAYALPRHESAHINSAEIDAIVIALKLWLPTLAGGFVIIHTDNTTAEAAFGSGTTRSTESMNLLRDAAVLAAAADIKLYACRVSSADNGLSAALSRLDLIRVAN